MMGIFEQLSWLTTRVKRLCCAVDKINESGAGSYKVYTAILNQVGKTDPTVTTLLENTIDVDGYWDYHNNGSYYLISPNQKFTDKIIGFVYSGLDDDSTRYEGFIVKYIDSATIEIFNPTGVNNHAAIRVEIRIYN
jgi:hypothetical protein